MLLLRVAICKAKSAEIGFFDTVCQKLYYLSIFCLFLNVDENGTVWGLFKKNLSKTFNILRNISKMLQLFKQLFIKYLAFTWHFFLFEDLVLDMATLMLFYIPKENIKDVFFFKYLLRFRSKSWTKFWKKWTERSIFLYFSYV